MKILQKKRSSTSTHLAADLYTSITIRSRRAVFYTHYQIPDTPSGRFEVLALHLALILRCLKLSSQTDLAQELCNWVVADLEESLRILPVRELKISRHLKEFIEGFYGRLMAYDKALEVEDMDMLKEAISRNVYGGVQEMQEGSSKDLAIYALQVWKELQSASLYDIIHQWKVSL